jgi:hypothetical protein
MRIRQLTRFLCVLALLAFPALVAAATTTPGQIQQAASPKGCLSEFDSGGSCGQVLFLQGPYDVVATHDGRNVYAGSSDGNGIAIFRRNLADGTLTQATGLQACISSTFPGCAGSNATEGTTDVEVTPDDRQLYSAATGRRRDQLVQQEPRRWHIAASWLRRLA